MMAELVQDVKAEFRESPLFAVMVVLAIVAGIGLNGSILRGAEGDTLRVVASQGVSIEDQADRLRHLCSTDLKPGFTLLVGLRQYSVELSVPVAGMHSPLDGGAEADRIAGLEMEHTA